MSFEEKSTWAYLAIAVVVPIWYFPTVLSQLDTTPAGDIDYVGYMVAAILAGIVLTIIAAIIIAATAPNEADKRDERDTSIGRFGDYIGGSVLAVLVAGVLVITWFEAEHFWIANAIYAAFIIQAATSSIVKLVGYRRGF